MKSIGGKPSDVEKTSFKAERGERGKMFIYVNLMSSISVSPCRIKSKKGSCLTIQFINTI